jgi:hypothetical protein
MNLLESRIVLRERPLLDVLDLALRFVASSAKPYGLLSLVSLVPSFAVVWASLHFGGPIVAWAVAIFFGLLVEPLYTVLASRLVFAPSTKLRDVFSTVLRRGVTLGAIRVLQCVALSLTSVVLFVPGLWVVGVLLFVIEATLLENATFGKAIERSRRIAGADMGDALLATILLFGGHASFVIAFDAAGRAVVETILQSTPPRALFDVGATPLALFAFLAYFPFLATARFLVYLNLRTRSEGWDIQTRFTGIAARLEAQR